MTVVVGYVSSPAGDAALAHAVAEARHSKEQLLVVNASSGDAYVDRRFLQGEDLETLRKTLADSGVDHEVLQPVRGNSAAEEIVATAVDRDARLVVVGLRRRTPVGKLILGSTSQQVLLDAPCDVLAVKSGMDPALS